jgi:periplasmic protein TonB
MKVLISHLAAMLLVTVNAAAQAKADSTQSLPIDSASNNPKGIILVVENPPMPVGGYPDFYKFLSSNIKYPKEARKSKIEGKVFVEFIVERDGTISPENVRVLKGVHRSLDAEAVLVIKMSPQWVPGNQKGRTVRTRMVMPLNFSL